MAWWIGLATVCPGSSRARSWPRCRSAALMRSSFACRSVNWFSAIRVRRRRGCQSHSELRHHVPDAASLRQRQTGPARVDSWRGRRGRLAVLEIYRTCSAQEEQAASNLGGIPIDYQHQDFVEEIHRRTGEGVMSSLTVSVARISGVPQGSLSKLDSRGLWPDWLSTRGFGR